MHDFGASESFCQKDKLWSFGFNVCNQPLPKRKRLGVRVINPKNVETFVCPKQYNISYFFPQSFEVFIVIVKRVYIFVFFGGIFCKFNGTVRSEEHTSELQSRP